MNDSDEAIAIRVQKGEHELFGVLMNRYEKKLVRYGRKFLVRREDIEDIVQDVFIRTYQSMQSFRPDERFSPWIYRIAHNAFVNCLRRIDRGPLLIDFDTLLSHPVYEDPDVSEREQKDMRVTLDRALDKIKPKYREVLVLHYFEEMSYKDIAEVLQVPQGTVGIRLRRAKEMAKKILEKEHAHNE